MKDFYTAVHRSRVEMVEDVQSLNHLMISLELYLHIHLYLNPILDPIRL